MLIELTIGLPGTHFRPASMTLHFDESIITGTRAMSGSAAISLRKVVIAHSASSSPSSMFTSMTCAPFSTCWRATSTAAVKSPARISRLHAAEPVALVRSPMLTKVEEERVAVIEKPAKTSIGERPREDAVVIELAADVEPAGRDVGKALLAIEGERPLVARIDAEEQAAMPLCSRNGALHQRGAKAAAVKARQRIDALELDIALLGRRQIGPGAQREADRRAARLRFGDPPLRARRDRKRAGAGKRGSVRVEIGGRRILK